MIISWDLKNRMHLLLRKTNENGMTAKVETHKRMKNAENAVDAMNCRNRADIAQGYGFPCGVPTYSIKTIVK